MRYDVLLVGCSYEKLGRPAQARDIYRAGWFRLARQYAERHSRPWFILSGEHALVRPTDWLAPYDTDLTDTTPEYRSAWGRWAVVRLARLCGSLDGLVIEIHAPRSYVEPLAEHLRTSGADLQLPLADIAWDHWPAWYRRQSPSSDRQGWPTGSTGSGPNGQRATRTIRKSR